MICAKELPAATLAAEIGLGLYWGLSSLRHKWIQKVSFEGRQKEGEEFLSVLTADQKSEMTVDIERSVRDELSKESFDVSEDSRSSVSVRLMLPHWMVSSLSLINTVPIFCLWFKLSGLDALHANHVFGQTRHCTSEYTIATR